MALLAVFLLFINYFAIITGETCDHCQCPHPKPKPELMKIRQLQAAGDCREVYIWELRKHDDETPEARV